MKGMNIKELDAVVLEINNHMDAVAKFAEKLRHWPETKLKGDMQEYVFAYQNWLAVQTQNIINQKIDLGY